MNAANRVEFGDFQTPLALARRVCSLLVAQGLPADAVLEPTCGIGAFLLAAAEAFPKARLLGWDINRDYARRAEAALARAGAGGRATVAQQDFFAHDWETELSSLRGEILLLGNLPWVTNATVSALNGSNLPAQENFLGLRGIEARTGKSNFDISEWMLIRLVKALRGRMATIAMLCKTATARKLLRFAWQNDGRIAQASLYVIDAKKHFGASVDACLLLARTGQAGPAEAEVFEDLTANRRSTTLGLAGQDLVADIEAYRRLRHLEGLCPYQWRSGVKHDCASVMELSRARDGAAGKVGPHGLEHQQADIRPRPPPIEAAGGDEQYGCPAQPKDAQGDFALPPEPSAAAWRFRCAALIHGDHDNYTLTTGNSMKVNVC